MNLKTVVLITVVFVAIIICAGCIENETSVSKSAGIAVRTTPEGTGFLHTLQTMEFPEGMDAKDISEQHFKSMYDPSVISPFSFEGMTGISVSKRYDQRTLGFTLEETPVIPSPYSEKGAAMYVAGTL